MDSWSSAAQNPKDDCAPHRRSEAKLCIVKRLPNGCTTSQTDLSISWSDVATRASDYSFCWLQGLIFNIDIFCRFKDICLIDETLYMADGSIDVDSHFNKTWAWCRRSLRGRTSTGRTSSFRAPAQPVKMTAVRLGRRSRPAGTPRHSSTRFPSVGSSTEGERSSASNTLQLNQLWCPKTTSLSQFFLTVG